MLTITAFINHNNLFHSLPISVYLTRCSRLLCEMDTIYLASKHGLWLELESVHACGSALKDKAYDKLFRIQKHCVRILFGDL